MSSESCKSGIYEIVNLINGKRYVGRTADFEKRWKRHQGCLRRNVHHAVYLMRSWKLNGADNFEFRILERVEDLSMLPQREQYYIDELKPEYNSAPATGSGIGRKWSDEQRSKMKDRWARPEIRKMYVDAIKLAMQTAENKAKSGTGMKGKKLSPESRSRMSASQRLRRQNERQGAQQ